MDSSHHVFCCTRSSKAKHGREASRSWKGLATSVGGNTVVALIRLSIIPSRRGRWCHSSRRLTERPAVAKKPHGPSSCWAVSQANARDGEGRSKAFNHFSWLREEVNLNLVIGLVITPTLTDRGVLSGLDSCGIQPRWGAWSAKCCGTLCANPGKVLALQSDLL